MSKGKKINSFIDLLKRPVYNQIHGLLISNPPMTSKEINQRFHMKPQTLNTYLKNLVNTGLIKKIQTGNAKQVISGDMGVMCIHRTY